MQKFCLFVFAALISVVVFALDDITLPSDGSFYEGNIATRVFSNLTVNGSITAAGMVTANGGLTGTHTNYNCAEATIGAATIQTNATVGGTLGVTCVATFSDDIICDKIIFEDVPVAALTNDAVYGFLVTVNETNYYLNLFPANDE